MDDSVDTDDDVAKQGGLTQLAPLEASKRPRGLEPQAGASLGQLGDLRPALPSRPPKPPAAVCRTSRQASSPSAKRPRGGTSHRGGAEGARHSCVGEPICRLYIESASMCIEVLL